jgi:outer membrane lipoprotein-sorting protein
MLAGLALAAAIDGKWVSERKMERNGETTTMTTTFDLKSSGSALTGTVTASSRRGEPRPIEIKDGKIDGNNFSFTTVMTSPNGEMKMTYKGTVEGTTLKGTTEREGGEPRPFEAKKQ